MLKDLKIVRHKVVYILENYPETRDDDKLLCLAYCNIFLDMKSHLDGYQKFKDWFMQKKVPAFESLTRCRRKMQEKNPELRGKSWSHRKHEETLVRQWSKDEINNYDS